MNSKGFVLALVNSAALGFQMEQQFIKCTLVLVVVLSGAIAVSAAEQGPHPQLAPLTKWKLDPKLEKQLSPVVRKKVRRCLDLPTVGECDECVAKASKRAELLSVPLAIEINNPGGNGVSRSSQVHLASCAGWGRV